MDIGERRRAQRTAILANLGLGFFLLSTGFQGDDLYQLYATQVLKLSARQIGMIAAAMILVVPAQVAAIPLIQQYGKTRVLQVGYLVRLVLFLGMPFLLIPGSGHHLLTVWLFAILVVGISIAHSCSFNMAWPPLMKDITEPGERGRFFSRVRSLGGAVTLGLLLGFGWCVGESFGKTDYLVLTGICTAYLVWSLAIVGRIPETHTRRTARGCRASLKGLRADVAVLLGQADYRRFLLLAGAAQFVAMPLKIVYGQAAYGVSDREAALYTSVAYGLAIVSLLAWGRFVDALGAVRILRIGSAGFGVMVACVLLLPLDPEGTRGWVALAYLGIASLLVALKSGVALAVHTRAYSCLGRGDAVVGLAVYGFVLDVGGLLMKSITGWLLGPTVAGGGDAAYAYLNSYRAFLALPLCAALVIGLWGRRTVVSLRAELET